MEQVDLKRLEQGMRRIRAGTGGLDGWVIGCSALFSFEGPEFYVVCIRVPPLCRGDDRM